MGEFPPPPPFSEPPSFFFFLSLHKPQTPQPGFGCITLLQKFTPHFKILDPRLLSYSPRIENNRVTLDTINAIFNNYSINIVKDLQ